MPEYRRVKYYHLNKPYWDIEVIPEPSPSPNDYYTYKIDTRLTAFTTENQFQYEIPDFGSTDNEINVDWGDGNISSGLTSVTTHTYSTPGIYTIKLYPNVGEKINIIQRANSIFLREDHKIIEFINWGSNVTDWTRMLHHFINTPYMSGFTTSTPILTNVTDMGGMFSNSTLFNQDISSWDVSNVNYMDNMFSNSTSFNQDISSWNVSNVTNMYYMFRDATSFNQPLNSWNVSNVTNMREMFRHATSFNQPLNSWNVSNVTNMQYMFRDATSFNQSLNSWNVSNVTNMRDMFYSATSFNQDISSWDVSGVTNMEYMFFNATAFNQDISSWNVSGVTNMLYMFRDATSFNQDLGSWNIGNVTNMSRMFSDSGLSTTNYDNILIGWAAQAPNIQSNVILGAQGINRTSASASAYNLLTNTYSWFIADSGEI